LIKLIEREEIGGGRERNLIEAAGAEEVPGVGRGAHGLGLAAADDETWKKIGNLRE
jgi:hypothetical protein